MAFGEVSVDVESRRVRAPTGASSLEPLVFDLLLTLVERPGLTASRGHLIETVWGDDEGSDEALSQAVAKLRRALGDDARAPRFIETVPKLGYRWIFEELPHTRPPVPRWSLGPAWVAGSAALANRGRRGGRRRRLCLDQGHGRRPVRDPQGPRRAHGRRPLPAPSPGHPRQGPPVRSRSRAAKAFVARL